MSSPCLNEQEDNPSVLAHSVKSDLSAAALVMHLRIKHTRFLAYCKAAIKTKEATTPNTFARARIKHIIKELIIGKKMGKV